MENMMYQGQKVTVKNIGIDSPEYRLKIDQQEITMQTDGDGYWGAMHEYYRMLDGRKYQDAVLVEVLVPDSETMENLRQYVNYFFKEVEQIENLSKNFDDLSTAKLIPSEEKIREILSSIGKKTKDQELNCGSCGYPTCRDKAIAVYQGKADLNMCLPHLKEKAESFTDTIIDHTPNGVLVMNYNLEVQLINKSATNILNIGEYDVVIGKSVAKFIDPYLYVKALTNDINIIDNQAFFEGLDKYIRQSVIHDREYQLLIVIMKDISVQERALERKEQLDKQTIETANKVIEKQMRIAQEIASLLGETTAETKIALTKLKESLKNEE